MCAKWAMCAKSIAESNGEVAELELLRKSSINRRMMFRFLFLPRPEAGRSMQPAELEVLYEDNHCLAINKPAGWLTMGDETGDETLVDVVKEYLRIKYQKPGDVFLGVVHRIDRPVSGVVLFGRTSKGAARLSEQFRTHAIQKTYWAIVEGTVHPAQGQLESWLRKDTSRNFVEVVEPGTPGAQHAQLEWKIMRSLKRGLTLLEVQPQTGRSHQIRVQLANSGWPILGDRKYGATQELKNGIGLHARSLKFDHPTRHEAIQVTAEPPPGWATLLS